MIIRKIIVFGIFFLALLKQGYTQNNEFKLLKSSQSLINLQENLAYGTFDVNSNYLAWFEYYQSKIFIYNISNGKINAISVNKGRGPGEYLYNTDLLLIKDKVLISDPKNAKILEIDIESEEKKDIQFRSSSLDRFIKKDNMIFFLDIIRPNHLISYISYEDLYKDNPSTFKLKGLKLQNEFENPFYKEGHLVGQTDNVLLITRYRPHIYLFDVREKNFEDKVVIDESEIGNMRSIETSEGARAMYPPNKVDILIEDAIHNPRNPHSVFILARGKSPNRNYSLNKLYEFDFINEEFIAVHDLSVKAKDITANDDYLFVYSEEKSKIYKFEFVSSE